MFEWQRHTQKSTDVPHYQELLDFLNLRAQASESSITEGSNKKPRHDTHLRKGYAPSGSVASHAAHTEPYSSPCIAYLASFHCMHVLPSKTCNNENKVATLKSNNLCVNCFSSNHFVKQCKSVHRCKQCQKPHHTLLHVDSVPTSSSPASTPSTIPINSTPATVIPPKIPVSPVAI